MSAKSKIAEAKKLAAPNKKTNKLAKTVGKKLDDDIKAKKRKKRGASRPTWCKFSMKRVLSAIENTGGVVRQIAMDLGCDRQTVYNYIETFPEIKKAIMDEREDMLDMAEGGLYQLASGGHETCIFYILNNRGQARGFGRQDTKQSDAPVDVRINLVSASVMEKLQQLGVVAPPKASAPQCDEAQG